MSAPLRAAARERARRHGIDADLFERQIEAESSFRPDAVSHAGALGIAQIMPATAKDWGVDPRDPVASLDAAARWMGRYLRAYGGDWPLALAAYNAGPGAVRRYGGVPPFAETRGYIVKVLGRPPSASRDEPPWVALTFNEVPGPGTDAVLDVLGRHGARGTFFVVASAARRRPATLRRLAAEGHEVATHSLARRENVEIERTIGGALRLYRPREWPGGRDEVDEAASLDLTTLGWTLGPKNGTPAQVERMPGQIANAADDGSIVLMGEAGARTAAALDALVSALGARGYGFPRASELLRRPGVPREWSACAGMVLPHLAAGGAPAVAVRGQSPQ